MTRLRKGGIDKAFTIYTGNVGVFLRWLLVSAMFSGASRMPHRSGCPPLVASTRNSTSTWRSNSNDGCSRAWPGSAPQRGPRLTFSKALAALAGQALASIEDTTVFLIRVERVMGIEPT